MIISSGISIPTSFNIYMMLFVKSIDSLLDKRGRSIISRTRIIPPIVGV